MRSLLSAIGFAAVLVASAADPGVARTPCPGAVKLVASEDRIHVYETRSGAVRACWKPTGRSTVLATRAQRFRLGEASGRSVAYSVFDNEAYIYLSVRRMDVRAGRLRVDVAATFAQAGNADDGGGAQVDEVRLARAGVAWSALNPRLGNRWEVGYVPGGTIGRDPKIVGSSPSYEPGSLALGRSHLYWSTADGVPQRAAY